MWRALQDRESTAISSRSLKSCISKHLVTRVRREKLLKEHTGCVNCVAFTTDGSTLISGSDDRDICIWNWQQGTLKTKFPSGHTNNIFQAKLLPHTTDTLVTCAADGQVRRAILKPDGSQTWRRLASHDGRSHKLSLVPDQPQCFASCGEDGQVLLFDLRQSTRRGGSESGTSSTAAAPVNCMVASMKIKELQGSDPLELHSIHHHPTRPWLYVIGGADCVARVYDMRHTLVPGLPRSTRPPTVSELRPNHMPLTTNSWSVPRYHITMAMFARDGQVLSTYNDEHIYLFSAEATAGQQQELAAARPTSGSGAPSKRAYRKRSRSDDPERSGGVAGDGGVTRSDQEEGEPAGDDGAAAAGPSSSRQPASGAGGGGSASQAATSSRQDHVVQVFKGHRNCQTVKGVNLWGEHEEYIVSGSDCGHVFVWDRRDAGLLRCMPGDSWVVNCLEPHPSLPLVMATSGIDHDIKIWTPTAPDDDHLESFDDVMAAVASNKQRRQRHEQRQRTREPRIPNWFIRILQRRHAALASTARTDPVDDEEAAEDEEEAEAADRESARDLLSFVLDTSSAAELRRIVNRVVADSNDDEEDDDEEEEEEEEEEDDDDDDDDMPAWVSAGALDSDSGSGQNVNDDEEGDEGDEDGSRDGGTGADEAAEEEHEVRGSR